MSQVEAANAIIALISLVFVIFWYFWLYQDYRIDSVRQRLFAIRDDLFDYAASGKIDFNAPAYRQLREILNVRIRYAHKLNAWMLIAFGIFLSKDMRKLAQITGCDEMAAFNASLASLNEEQQKKLKASVTEMNFALVYHQFMSSFVLWVFAIIPWLLLHVAGKKMRSALIRQLEREPFTTAIKKTSQVANACALIDEGSNHHHFA